MAASNRIEPEHSHDHGSGQAIFNRHHSLNDAATGARPHMAAHTDARVCLAAEAFAPKGNTAKPLEPPAVSQHREALITSFNNAIDHVSDPYWHNYLLANKKQFAKNIDTFAANALKHNLEGRKVTGTFQQIERLLNDEPNAAVDQSKRVRLAFETMEHAAKPTEISQGHYRTCNVTTVEVQTMYRNPAEMAKLIADEAINGVYIAPDGKRVEIDHQSLIPVGDAANPLNNGSRSFATQIANVALVNLGHAEEELPLRYHQDLPNSELQDNGERLVDSRTQAVVKLSPGLSDAQIARVDALLNGGKPIEYLATSSEVGRIADGTRRIASEEELDQLLTERKEHNDFPLTVRVNCASPVFVEDAGHGFDPQRAWHVVNIVDYNPKTQMVSLDNEWKNAEDHIGKHGVPLPYVFEAMRDPEAANVDYHARALVLRALNCRDFSLELKAWQRSLSLGTPEWVVLPAVKQIIIDAVKRGRGPEVENALRAVNFQLSNAAQAEVHRLIQANGKKKKAS